MKFVSDPPIATKIRKMKQRVRWKDPAVVKRKIDQTRLVIADNSADNTEFSFLVIGDSGTGYHHGYSPQRKIAELLLEHRDCARFLLHTGDIIYLVGSSEYYPKNFISPYREFLVGGENPSQIAYDRMIFKLPFLPVPGNHDYYDLPKFYSLLAQVTRLPRRFFGTKIDLNIGWHGSGQGQAYAKAFLDYLLNYDQRHELEAHLDRHYTAKTETGRCLHYLPRHFTRLPNRYYSFRYGGIDFFAIDSNTFNAPPALPHTPEGEEVRQQLHERFQELEQQEQRLMEDSARLDPENSEECDRLDDNNAKLEQIGEIKLDIDKKLKANQKVVTDFEQLDWLRRRLIESWQTPGVRGRVLFFHHPPYVTEVTKWEQAQTLQVRHHLRQVLDAVAKAVGEIAAGRPIVDLVLNGHAHCLEHLQTVDTGHGDANINWLICGGSGHSLRRQRPEGTELMETLDNGEAKLVARSHLYIGRHGHGKNKHRCYSALRIDVLPGSPPKFRVHPLVAEHIQDRWYEAKHEAFLI